MTRNNDRKRYLANRQKEIDGAALYRALAESEAQPQMADLYNRFAAAEEKHAAAWEKRLAEGRLEIPERRVSWRARAMIWLARRFGAQFILPTVTGLERADSQAYDGQPEVEAGQFSADEKSHARLLTAAGGSGSGLAGGNIAQLEGRHRASGGNALRAAVLGANDGLVSILSLTMGVAGATNSNTSVLIAGLAGLLAGAGSMALGEWLSVQSARELFAHQIKIEKQEIEENPQEEMDELALIYQSKGLPEARARELASHMMADRSNVVDTLAREELGIDPKELGGSAYEAAFTSFGLFAVGAAFPMLPFVFSSGSTAIFISLGASAAGLFLIGAAITLMTGRTVLFTGVRQVLVGMAAAGLTYGIGRLIGVSVG
ncbi:MAG TPA: VIT1/CCC1 transporter family protein [Anaerolineales bacterium]